MAARARARVPVPPSPIARIAAPVLAVVVVVAVVLVVVIVPAIVVVAVPVRVVVLCVPLSRVDVLAGGCHGTAPKFSLPRVILVPAAALASELDGAVLLARAAPAVSAAAWRAPAAFGLRDVVGAEFAAAAAVRAHTHPNPDRLLVLPVRDVYGVDEEQKRERDRHDERARPAHERRHMHVGRPLGVRVHNRGARKLRRPRTRRARRKGPAALFWCASGRARADGPARRLRPVRSDTRSRPSAMASSLAHAPAAEAVEDLAGSLQESGTVSAPPEDADAGACMARCAPPVCRLAPPVRICAHPLAPAPCGPPHAAQPSRRSGCARRSRTR